MRFLLDQNLSPRLAGLLSARGLAAAHADELGLREASDERVLLHAREHGFTIITQDSDFSTALALTGAVAPSVIHLRDAQAVSSRELAVLLNEVLSPSCVDALTSGAIVTVRDTGYRIRSLPVSAPRG